MRLLVAFGGGRPLRVAIVALAGAFACSMPDMHFVPDAVPDAGDPCQDPEHASAPECGPSCENGVLDGDETGADCGGSCSPCRSGQGCVTVADCQSQVCGDDGLCASATCSDGVQNGDELGVDCGGSFCDDGCAVGTACQSAIDCESHVCDPDTARCALNCLRGTEECDGDLDQPCETNVLTSVESCGACDHACELPHARASCVGGVCQIDSCRAPWLRCNTDGGDGCETDGSADVMNCGGCGVVCPDLHGTPTCAAGECAVDCGEGFGDCDRDARTGCETSLNDVLHCGSCDKACPDDEGVPFCVGGTCGRTLCDDGLGDCDGDKVCETDLGQDSQNCGRCGNVCGATNGTAICRDGACVISACNDGWGNCDSGAKDGGYANGCESNLERELSHCGKCDVSCSDIAHATGTCEAGQCGLDCASGFADCNGDVRDGCEVDTTTDAAHCGGCTNSCTFDHAAAACVGSTCAIDECEAGYRDCNAADGCETNVTTSVQHCGSCAVACSSAGATKISCSAGACDPPVCDAAHLSCDGDNENGCETDISTRANCGACGKACTGATPNCVATGAAYACQALITLPATAPYTTASAQAGSLTFNVTPRAGNNRLALLAIVSDALLNNAVSAGIAGARPGTVTFGGRNMTAGPSRAGTNDGWSPDLFVYYLALGDAGADEAQVQVVITGASGPANVVVAQALQLNGARQTTPITTSAGGFVGSPDPDDPGIANDAMSVTVSGSALYSFISDYWDTTTCTRGTVSSSCPTWSVSPAANLTLVETMATAPLNFYPPNSGNAPMRAFGMVVTPATPSALAAGTYSPTWSDPHPGRLTHLALVIAPAQAP